LERGADGMKSRAPYRRSRGKKTKKKPRPLGEALEQQTKGGEVNQFPAFTNGQSSTSGQVYLYRKHQKGKNKNQKKY